MGSFTLTLDTTGPDIEIFMPSYSTTSADNEIVVQGNELLAPWQDFYFIDAAGNRHDFIFAHDGDKFVGLVRFNQFALGVATLYAQVKDEVDNPSPLQTKAINILQGAYMTVCGSEMVRLLETGVTVRQLIAVELVQELAPGEMQREFETGHTARQIEVRMA